MTTLEVGKKLVDLVRARKNAEAMETLYDPNIVSVEAGAPGGAPTESTGVAACIEKGKQWQAGHEVHAANADGPFPHGDKFAVFLSYDVTQRESKQRFKMEEVAVYTVKNGKIVREEFFYSF